ncbi:signal peptidase II [Halalkalibacterium halodurans]|uniref:Lipoprotein signal peptidase n=1 Tax=Halalkalibacterium halodurans TaxID=86665 RepID=A0A0M0KIK7_ALKHA|nr:signal peptidase II [Halalkalibacterium halodurans]MED3646151.1 signal peptidase II [Halalkalibacterium halodurans]MED4079689.1 signal peptidase II [Halalkalibacterium halodurans]MED4086369.1 signal peptidase II [Halalkalibacterium halodurans]MED4103286.1 signal peptidase II [Halalkalibacterium halodurans]MED4108017.1 signal peptidase II [Halalkalibacterium halodurans]
MIYYIVALVIILLDQWTKWLVVRHMEIGESIPLIDSVLYLTSHRNKGAAFGILEGQMWLFYIITSIVVIGIVYYMEKEAKHDRVFATALALILGGAIGNFIDRIFRGEVVDFVNTYIFTYNFPIFNVADSALCVGVGILFLKMIRDERKAKKEKNA